MTLLPSTIVILSALVAVFGGAVFAYLAGWYLKLLPYQLREGETRSVLQAIATMAKRDRGSTLFRIQTLIFQFDPDLDRLARDRVRKGDR